MRSAGNARARRRGQYEKRLLIFWANRTDVHRPNNKLQS